MTIIRPTTMVLVELFLLYARDHSTNIYRPPSFVLSFAHDHLAKIYGLLSFILSFVHDHSTNNYDPHWFFFPPDYSTNMSGPLSLILSFANGHSNKNLGPHWFISFIYARPFDQNKCSSFIYSFSSGRPVDQKLGSSLTFFLFVHDHSIKIRGHSYSLIYSFLNCANISYTLFIARWCLSPCYHASHPNLILRGGHTNRSPYLLVLLGQPSLPSIRGQ